MVESFNYMLVILALVAAGASYGTFFTGFGLGTILLPIFLFFFPAETAITATALVHLLNNLLKLTLTKQHIHLATTIRFGIPAIVAAVIGAVSLVHLTDFEALYVYQLFGQSYKIMPVNLLVSTIMVAMAIVEIKNWHKTTFISARHMHWGGLLSGFLGGLSGHQGAFRSAFLLQAGLSSQQFIATGVLIACGVDISRLFVYGQNFTAMDWQVVGTPLIIAVGSAFAGAFTGGKRMPTLSLERTRKHVGWWLIITGICLALGLVAR